MINIVDNGGYIKVLNGDKTMWSFAKRRSSVSVGKGEMSFSMTRGSFRFSESINRKDSLYADEVIKNDEGWKIRLHDGNGRDRLLLTVSDDGEKIKLHFEELAGESVNRLWLTVPATEQEHVYGCGECFTKFDLRGEKVRIWVAEHQNANRIAKKVVRQKAFGKNPDRTGRFLDYETYYAQPTFLSSRKYWLHADSSAYMAFDFSKNKSHVLMIHELCDIYIGYSSSYKGLMTSLTGLLGRQPQLPDWAYDGMIFGIQGGTDAVIEKIAACREKNASIAGVWCQDWEGRRVTAFGKQLMWNWKWDEELYPGLDKAIPELKKQGIRFLGYVNTFLAVEKDLYAYASHRGYCVKNADGEDYLVTITTFPAAIVDLTNPEAYNWLKEIIKTNMIDFGLDGWMADFGEYLPTDCVLANGEDPKLMHNCWPALWAKLNREAVEERGKLGEVFFFTRAGFTDTVKYSTLMWNGDQHVDWSVDDGLPSVVPATLSLSVCGFGLCHSDVGGYTTYKHSICREPELLMRWAEMCAFSPLMRSHEGNQPDNNVQFDTNDEILSHISRMSRVHAAIKPYLKMLDAENSKCGIPVMRPAFFEYDEPRAYTEEYEYMLGKDVLVAPVVRSAQNGRTVWLPSDRWIHIWSGKEYGGGVANVYSPLGEPPVFIRKDSEWVGTFCDAAKL